MNEQERTWVVKYYESDLHLTGDEYTALAFAAQDDPVRADQMAWEFLLRERQGHADHAPTQTLR